MQTNLADFIKDTPEGKEADAILRKCVHCGFCTATCPTYQLLGDELDGPRGRIYLIKQVLEGAHADREDAAAPRPLPHLPRVRDHLPVRRALRPPASTSAGTLVEERVGARRRRVRVARRAERGDPQCLRCSGRCSSSGSWRARCCRPPSSARCRPRAAPARPWPTAVHARKMLVLEGCAQPSLSPATNAAAARVLDRLGIIARARGRRRLLRRRVVSPQRRRTRRSTTCARNIDAWWPHIEPGAEAIVMTASGCGVTVKDYGTTSSPDDSRPTPRTRRSASPNSTKDISEDHRSPNGARGSEPRHSGLIASRASSRAASRLPRALHPAARAEAEGRGGIPADRAGLRADAGARRAPVLRLGRHLFHPPAGAVAAAAGEQDRRARERRSPPRSSPPTSAARRTSSRRTALPVRHWIEALDESLSPSR